MDQLCSGYRAGPSRTGGSRSRIPIGMPGYEALESHESGVVRASVAHVTRTRSPVPFWRSVTDGFSSSR